MNSETKSMLDYKKRKSKYHHVNIETASMLNYENRNYKYALL